MVAALSCPRSDVGERRVLIHGVAWRDYVIAREALDAPGVRMTYLKGALEITSPSSAHETAKTSVARLIETYAFLVRLPLNGYGSTTFRRQAEERGAEPDECWVVGRTLEAAGGFPDIVLEVIETTPLLDKLDVYDGFGVPEVWIFERGAFAVHRRNASGGYLRAAKSALLPDIDLRRIAKLAAVKDQQAALEQLERGLRAARSRVKARRGTR